MRHALSFDIEDWFHIVDVDGLEPARWDALHAEHTLVERRTDQILELCAEAGVRATFFALGWIAQRHPALVRRIAEAGHELASHGHMHERVGILGRQPFADDLRLSIRAIEDAAGVRVEGYRAPSFSITPGCEWAFDEMAAQGITWDASLFPAARGHGGYPCPMGAHRVTAPGGAVLDELPMSVWSPPPLGRPRLAYSGGGYLRLLPLGIIQRAIEAEARAGRPTVAYLHPRDFAPDAPRWPMPPDRRFKCYVGLASTEGKLRRLLADYKWGTCREVLDEQLGSRSDQRSGASENPPTAAQTGATP
ncbi:MAG: polysaccharide deacetylase family protein [Planctomycetota bacterium]